jgi:anaerobic selenocysteine-containing dehydrogenase
LMHFTFELFGKALNWERLNVAQKIEKPETRTVNMIQIGRALNHSTNPPIHALFVYNSNPAVIAPDQNQVIKGLKREDLLTVVLEHFVTDTARYADYVLPATTQLEHWDLMESWGRITST